MGGNSSAKSTDDSGTEDTREQATIDKAQSVRQDYDENERTGCSSPSSGSILNPNEPWSAAPHQRLAIDIHTARRLLTTGRFVICMV